MQVAPLGGDEHMQGQPLRATVGANDSGLAGTVGAARTANPAANAACTVTVANACCCRTADGCL